MTKKWTIELSEQQVLQLLIAVEDRIHSSMENFMDNVDNIALLAQVADALAAILCQIEVPE